MKIGLLLGEAVLLLGITFIYSSMKLSSELSREENEENNN